MQSLGSFLTLIGMLLVMGLTLADFPLLQEHDDVVAVGGVGAVLVGLLLAVLGRKTNQPV